MAARFDASEMKDALSALFDGLDEFLVALRRGSLVLLQTRRGAANRRHNTRHPW
jgi:hypothetical protein